MKIALPVAIALAVWSSLSTANSLNKNSSVAEILNLLGSSTKTQSYRGDFTYEHDGTIDMMSVVHAVIDGVEYERIYHLNGPEKAFLREGQGVSCVTAGNHLLRGGRLTLSNGNMVSIDQNYQFLLRGEERIAGRDALVLQLLPRDPYRYGLVLGIDKQTALLTKAVITEGQKKVWERIQFVSLEVDEDMGIEAIYPSLRPDNPLAPLIESSMSNIEPLALASESAEPTGNSDTGSSDTPSSIASRVEGAAGEPSVADVASEEVKSLGGCRPPAASEAPLQPSWVPSGFVLSDYSYSEEDGHMETYTDGLSVFSVFIGRVSNEPAQAVVRNGATVSLLTSIPSQNKFVTVTVVGEVPAVTAHRVTQSLRVPPKR